jgi:DNA-binding transcriptional LysR family regulator
VVSDRVAQLERIVGMRLVERSRGQARVRVTDAGNILVAHSEGILAGFHAALADMRAIVADAQPTLRVGVDDSAARVLLGPAMRRLSSEDPELRVELHEDAGSRGFPALVRSGELDVALAELPLGAGPFAFRELRVDPWVLLVPACSSLARRSEPPTLREIGGLALIAPSRSRAAPLVEHLHAMGVEPRFVRRAETDAGVQTLVAHGLGAALMPRLAVIEDDSRIAMIGLGTALPPRRIALFWHRDRRAIGAIMRLVAALDAHEPSRSAA